MTAVSFSRTASASLTDKQQFRLMFAVIFPIVLAAMILIRMGRWAGRARAPAGTPKSLFAEARATSSGALLFAFMG